MPVCSGRSFDISMFRELTGGHVSLTKFIGADFLQKLSDFSATGNQFKIKQFISLCVYID